MTTQIMSKRNPVKFIQKVRVMEKACSSFLADGTLGEKLKSSVELRKYKNMIDHAIKLTTVADESVASDHLILSPISSPTPTPNRNSSPTLNLSPPLTR